MSEIIFNEISDQIQNRLKAQANYQFVMLKHVIINGMSSKTDICKKLAAANNTNDVKSFRNCPVFRVLENKKLIKVYNNNETEDHENYYNLHPSIVLTKNEKLDLIKILHAAKLRYESK